MALGLQGLFVRLIGKIVGRVAARELAILGRHSGSVTLATQRGAVARAFLGRPDVLIFDEATNDLNNETAEEVAKPVDLLKRQATMLFTTHQVATALKVDELVILHRHEAQIAVPDEHAAAVPK